MVLLFTDEAQQAEAIQVLGKVFEVRERQSIEKPEKLAKIAHTLSMLYYILHDLEKVKKIFKKKITCFILHTYLMTCCV